MKKEITITLANWETVTETYDDSVYSEEYAREVFTNLWNCFIGLEQ